MKVRTSFVLPTYTHFSINKKQSLGLFQLFQCLPEFRIGRIFVSSGIPVLFRTISFSIIDHFVAFTIDIEITPLIGYLLPWR